MAGFCFDHPSVKSKFLIWTQDEKQNHFFKNKSKHSTATVWLCIVFTSILHSLCNMVLYRTQRIKEQINTQKHIIHLQERRTQNTILLCALANDWLGGLVVGVHWWLSGEVFIGGLVVGCLVVRCSLVA